MGSNEEKILVFYLKQGSSKAFEQLFLTYHKKLYHFCKKILNSKEESENLVQSVFMEIWENRIGIDEEKSFNGYLFKIAKGKVYNTLRKNINERVYLEYIAGNNSFHEIADGNGYESKQLADTIENLINSMPERRKEIFRLSRDKGLTYKEIAQQLQISENTVDTQIRNALDFLREELEKMR
jgi:RNA polymerase sigma-70 factor (ECF subfamily)